MIKLIYLTYAKIFKSNFNSTLFNLNPTDAMLFARYCVEMPSSSKQHLNPNGFILIRELKSIIRFLFNDFRILSKSDFDKEIEKLKEVKLKDYNQKKKKY